MGYDYTYTMRIEKPAGVVKQHGFHLGTIRPTAEAFVMERLRADPEIVSIALWRGDSLDQIYDHKDVGDYYSPPCL